MCINLCNFTHKGAMRTNIEIDDDLLAEAMEATGLKTKRGVVEEALRRLALSSRRKRAIEELAGAGWVGDLEETRRDRDDGDAP
jgi:Arc/MetJ family transcription regulator